MICFKFEIFKNKAPSDAVGEVCFSVGITTDLHAGRRFIIYLNIIHPGPRIHTWIAKNIRLSIWISIKIWMSVFNYPFKCGYSYGYPARNINASLQ